jgi:hypothetical protein
MIAFLVGFVWGLIGQLLVLRYGGSAIAGFTITMAGIIGTLVFAHHYGLL